MSKTARTYRFDLETLLQLQALTDYYSHDLLKHPGDDRKVTATKMLEFIIQEHYRAIFNETPEEEK